VNPVAVVSGNLIFAPLLGIKINQISAARNHHFLSVVLTTKPGNSYTRSHEANTVKALFSRLISLTD
jgi:hypothetical protein